MKTRPSNLRGRLPGHSRRGSAVLVMLILLAFMMIFFAANTVTVNALRKQVKAIDAHEVRQLARFSSNQVSQQQSTNNPPSSK